MPLLLVILATLVAVPLAEIAVFIRVGGVIGVWPTIALVVATAVVGTWLIRLQGLATLARAQQALDRQDLPVQEIFEGLCLLVAGVLLITPGFVTDAAGFALLVPPVRRAVAAWLFGLLRARTDIRVDIFGRRGSGRSCAWGAGGTALRGRAPPGRGRGRS